ncbi:hypothetical protein [Ornithinimicrobium avium]|uniref:Uncharacterized protein n=1 Tax=Ornithinimicrobium avium TaxID=2283195 RepID=A0A345NM37_9MICO|nr:hypothetical protein [Ornithinimicrobium avium]AXH96095.1 hypothetical protein DV701_08095 [Ornithinimicrobium avium]
MKQTTDYHRLAPSAEKDWVEAFVLEQRLLGVPGDRIGDALAVVESHVAESGEGAQEAFGEARAYARQTADGRKVDDLAPAWVAGVVLGLLGMLVTLAGVSPWLAGEARLEITLGWVATLVLTLAGAGALVLATETVLRLAVDRPWAGAGIVAAFFVVTVVLAVALRQPVADVPVVAVVVVGAAMLALSTALELREVLRGEVEDPILGPGETAPLRRVTGSGVLTACLMPLLTVLLVTLDWAVTALA